MHGVKFVVRFKFVSCFVPSVDRSNGPFGAFVMGRFTSRVVERHANVRQSGYEEDVREERARGDFR